MVSATAGCGVARKDSRMTICRSLARLSKLGYNLLVVAERAGVQINVAQQMVVQNG